jgi:hypothetical protein
VVSCCTPYDTYRTLSVHCQLKSKVRFGKLDSTSHKGTTNKYGVKGYPSLKLFRDGIPKEYKGGRNLESLVAYGERVVGTVSTLEYSRSP